MKRGIFTAILIVAFLIPVNTHAQLGSALKKKLEQSVNKAVEKETPAEATEENAEPSDEETPPAMKMPNLGIGKVKVKYEEVYNFKGLMVMKTELYDKGKQEGVMDVNMWFDAENSSMGMESRTVTAEEGQEVMATAIVDMKNMVMITFADVNGSKTGMISPLPDTLTEAGAETEEPGNKADVRKTGNTKTICGYRCEEYIMTEEEGKLVSNVWASEELALKSNKHLYNNQKGMPRDHGMGEIKGAMMASETREKGELTYRMEVTKIDFEATHSISTVGVGLMQMDMSKWGQKKK